MPTVGAGLAISFDNILQRFPALRDIPLLRSKRSDGETSPAALAALIESQIIPRLLIAHLPIDEAQASHPGVAIERKPLEAAQLARFAEQALTLEVADLMAEVDRYLESGMTVESVLLDLFAPTARELGLFWEQDRCGFVDVTMGLWRLQELTHELATRIRPVAPAWSRPRRILLGVMPDEQHLFGLQLVGEFFSRAGWDPVIRIEGDLEAMCEDVASTPFDLVGLTVNHDRHVEQLPGFIDSLRSRSVNPALLVMVGGAVVAGRPELAFIVGADATANDAPTAVLRAETLLNAHGLTGARAC